MKKVKDDYFTKPNGEKKELAKCQNTNVNITYDEAHVDHRQPRSFPEIVDRFIELNDIDIKFVEYETIKQYGHIFKDSKISDLFRDYHKKRALLRVVLKDENLKRSHLARVNAQKKDITVTA